MVFEFSEPLGCSQEILKLHVGTFKRLGDSTCLGLLIKSNRSLVPHVAMNQKIFVTWGRPSAHHQRPVPKYNINNNTGFRHFVMWFAKQIGSKYMFERSLYENIHHACYKQKVRRIVVGL